MFLLALDMIWVSSREEQKRGHVECLIQRLENNLFVRKDGQLVMNIVPLIIIFMVAFLLQYLLSFKQMKDFNHHYSYLRKQGRVAIGVTKGGFKAGAIAMFSIDDRGKIIEFRYLQGVTVFSRFKSFVGFEGKAVECLSEDDCKKLKLAKPITKAVLEASSNYQIFISGKEIPTPPSNFQRLTRLFKHKNKMAS